MKSLRNQLINESVDNKTVDLLNKVIDTLNDGTIVELNSSIESFIDSLLHDTKGLTTNMRRQLLKSFSYVFKDTEKILDI